MKNPILITCLLSALISPVCADSLWLEAAMNARIDEKMKETTPTSFPKTKAQPSATGFFSDHQLVLFFSSKCPYCLQFAPVLKTWSGAHLAPILALSFDNQPLPEFLNFQPVSTEWVSAAFGSAPINYPALFIVNTTTHVIYPVSTGFLSEVELDDRMKAIATKILSYESRGRV